MFGKGEEKRQTTPFPFSSRFNPLFENFRSFQSKQKSLKMDQEFFVKKAKEISEIIERNTVLCLVLGFVFSLYGKLIVDILVQVLGFLVGAFVTLKICAFTKEIFSTQNFANLCSIILFGLITAKLFYLLTRIIILVILGFTSHLTLVQLLGFKSSTFLSLISAFIGILLTYYSNLIVSVGTSLFGTMLIGFSVDM